MNAERILVLAPLGRDGPLIRDALVRAEIEAQVCADLSELCALLPLGVGAAVLTQEALPPPALHRLIEVLAQEPPWSDLPLVILGNVEISQLSNVSFLDRPLRARLLVGTVQAALRARRRQYQVRDLLAELQQSVRDRDQFLAMLGHELRNPLAAIVTASELLDRKAQGAMAAERRVLARQARNLSRLVDDLLDVARVTRGKIALHEEPLDFRELVERVCDGFVERAQQQGVELAAHLPSAPVRLAGDQLRLEQVLTNLLTNAVKYSNAGTRVDVMLGCEGVTAVLRIKDQGVGISPSLLPRVFDLFTQAPGALDRAQGGMGIGLTLVRSLVELHRGSVEAHSDGAGKGSEFVVRLPLAAADRATAAGEQPAKGRALRVLLVEDGADAREVLRLALEQMGHAVDTAQDGGAAVERALATRPDAMLVDLGLAGKDGFEVAQLVRAKLGSSVRLVALTGYGQPGDRDRAVAAGFDAFLVKPASFEAVQAALAA
ncbi:MAG TPA: hybrid sensor histidine kinase/response regulator [Myxococcales bacterium]